MRQARCSSVVKFGIAKRLQHIHRGARQQRAVDLERRVFGGRADEGDQPALDIGQESVLLRLVEAVHFIDEQDGVAARLLQLELGALQRFADVLDAGEHRGDRDELGIERLRHQPRQRGLAHARRAPQDHRMRLARLEREPQRFARAQQMRLADDFVERARTQPLGERRRRGSASLRTGRSPLASQGYSVMTSAPLGGVNSEHFRRQACGLRSTSANLMTVTWPNWSRSSIASRPFLLKPRRMRSNAVSLVFGHRLQPVEPFLVAEIGQRIALLDFVAAGEQRRRAAAQRAVQLAHRDLVEVLVVNPQLRAVADDGLLVGLVVFPAEFARPRKLHGAGRLLQLFQVLVEHHLREARLAEVVWSRKAFSVSSARAAPRRTAQSRTNQNDSASEGLFRAVELVTVPPRRVTVVI